MHTDSVAEVKPGGQSARDGHQTQLFVLEPHLPCLRQAQT